VAPEAKSAGPVEGAVRALVDLPVGYPRVFCGDASPLLVLHPEQGQPSGQLGGRPAVYPVAHVELLLCREI
jgi:hypothetical protein